MVKKIESNELKERDSQEEKTTRETQKHEGITSKKAEGEQTQDSNVKGKQ